MTRHHSVTVKLAVRPGPLMLAARASVQHTTQPLTWWGKWEITMYLSNVILFLTHFSSIFLFFNLIYCLTPLPTIFLGPGMPSLSIILLKSNSDWVCLLLWKPFLSCRAHRNSSATEVPWHGCCHVLAVVTLPVLFPHGCIFPTPGGSSSRANFLHKSWNISQSLAQHRAQNGHPVNTCLSSPLCRL